MAADAEVFLLDGGERMPAALKVWAAGIRRPVASTRASWGSTARARSWSAPTCLAKGEQNVFALGQLRQPDAGRRGATATLDRQVANQQALHLIRHLPAWLRKGRPGAAIQLPRSRRTRRAQADYNPFGTLGRSGFFKGGFIKGRFAQLSHAVLYHRHQLSLHGPSRAALLWLADRINALVQPKIRIS